MATLESELQKLAGALHRHVEKRLTAVEFGPKPWRLPTPRILVMEPKRSRAVLGWYAHQRWEQGAVHLNELVLTPQAVRHGVQMAAMVILHEYVHLANAVADRPDTSRQGRYHNELFKETAEAIGLEVKRDDAFGWNSTSLGSELSLKVKKWIAAKRFALHPFKYRRVDTERKSAALVKMVAKCCDAFVYVTAARAESISVCCGICGDPFLPVDSHK